jgi:hypothetical protein
LLKIKKSLTKKKILILFCKILFNILFYKIISFITLTLPETPLFKSELEKNQIQQINIYNLLEKYNYKTENVNLLLIYS